MIFEYVSFAALINWVSCQFASGILNMHVFAFCSIVDGRHHKALNVTNVDKKHRKKQHSKYTIYST